jgi:hypothetical protein
MLLNEEIERIKSIMGIVAESEDLSKDKSVKR